jgi:L-2-hydroxyglutarate oxidase
VIVAVDQSELPALEQIEQRGLANGVQCQRIGREQLTQLEPHAAGVAALHVPETGIVDFQSVCRRLARLIQQAGSQVRTEAGVERIQRDGQAYALETTSGTFRCSALVNCAGLFSDRVTAMTGQRPAARIVPFRGEYYELKPTAYELCRNLIYPVPDPQFPFLGVHFTRMLQGGVECGPNAVLAFAREGYRKTSVNVRDTWDSLSYRGFLRLAARYWRMGLGEMTRSLSKRAFVAALQKLIPEITADDLVAGRAGVRAQAVLPDGQMVDDFLIQQHERCVNVANAPSPAATSALNIGSLIVDKLATVLD